MSARWPLRHQDPFEGLSREQRWSTIERASKPVHCTAGAFRCLFPIAQPAGAGWATRCCRRPTLLLVDSARERTLRTRTDRCRDAKPPACLLYTSDAADDLL